MRKGELSSALIMMLRKQEHQNVGSTMVANPLALVRPPPLP
jgi:hypothetical protein